MPRSFFCLLIAALCLPASLCPAQRIVVEPPAGPYPGPVYIGPGSRQLQRHLERVRGIHERLRQFGVPPHLEARFQEHEMRIESMLYPTVIGPSAAESGAYEVVPAPRTEGEQPAEGTPPTDLLPPPVERDPVIPPAAPGPAILPPPVEELPPPSEGRDASVPSRREPFALTAFAKPEEAAGLKEMFPRAPGNEWEYEIRYKLIFTPERSGTAITKIGGSERVEGRDYTRVETAVTGIPGVSEEVKQVRRDAEGNYRVPARDGEEAVLIPASPSVGQKWLVKHESGVDIQFEVLEQSKLETPAGLFDPCYRVKLSAATTFGTAVDEIWFSPGVGIVQEKKRRTAFSTTTTLKKFTPAATAAE